MTRISRLLGEDLFDRADLAARGEIKNIEREVTSKTGERRSVLIHLKKVSIQGSTVLYTCRDVTERRHAEEELRAARLELAHVSRLALVGELIASIAHEINQPLTSILSNASAGLRRLPADASPDDGAPSFARSSSTFATRVAGPARSSSAFGPWPASGRSSGRRST